MLYKIYFAEMGGVIYGSNYLIAFRRNDRYYKPDEKQYHVEIYDEQFIYVPHLI